MSHGSQRQMPLKRWEDGKPSRREHSVHSPAGGVRFRWWRWVWWGLELLRERKDLRGLSIGLKNKDLVNART